MDSIILSPKHCLPFINPGRLVKVRHGKKDFGWGIIVNFKKEKNTNPEEEPVYRVDVMCNCDKDSVKSNSSELAKPAKGKYSKKDFEILYQEFKMVIVQWRLLDFR